MALFADRLSSSENSPVGYAAKILPTVTSFKFNCTNCPFSYDSRIILHIRGAWQIPNSAGAGSRKIGPTDRILLDADHGRTAFRNPLNETSFRGCHAASGGMREGRNALRPYNHVPPARAVHSTLKPHHFFFTVFSLPSFTFPSDFCRSISSLVHAFGFGNDG